MRKLEEVLQDWEAVIGLEIHAELTTLNTKMFCGCKLEFGADPDYWRSVSPQQQLAREALPMLLVCSSTRRFPTSPCDEAGKLARRASELSVPMQVLPEALEHGEINARLGLPSAGSSQSSPRRLHRPYGVLRESVHPDCCRAFQSRYLLY